MRLLYTSDLHGEIHLYQELLSLASSSSAEVIVIGGDLLPSSAPTKRYEDMVPTQKTFIDQFLSPFFKRVLETTSVSQILLIPGNWDLAYPHLFKEQMEWIVDISERIYPLPNGYELIGYPFVPPTPFRSKEYEKMDDPDSAWPPQKNPSYIRSSDQMDQLIPVDPSLYLGRRGMIRDDLDRLPKPLDQKRAIYIMHSPPFGTRLDSVQGGRSVGSRSIKAFIRDQQPLLTLHGHIHESPEISASYFEGIGKTISINPGQSIRPEGGAGRLYAVTFEIEDVRRTLRHTCFPEVWSSESLI